MAVFFPLYIQHNVNIYRASGTRKQHGCFVLTCQVTLTSAQKRFKIPVAGFHEMKLSVY